MNSNATPAGFIYLLTGVAFPPTCLGANGYFGLTRKEWPQRTESHISSLRNGSHRNPLMQGYVDEFGIDSVSILIVADVPEKYLEDLEQLYVERFKTDNSINPQGWNRMRGGHPRKYRHRLLSYGEQGRIIIGRACTTLRFSGRNLIRSP